MEKNSDKDMKIDDAQLECGFSSDVFKDYMKEVRKYPLLTDEEFDELWKKYQDGNMEAFDLLVNSNLRLVVYFAYQYKNSLVNLDIMDIIQEGTIALMNAIFLYNPDIAKFSTYASLAIIRGITRVIDNQDKTIRKSVHFETIRRQYYCLMMEYENSGRNIPSDEEICKILKISSGFLNSIKNEAKSEVLSLNNKSNTDTEFEYYIGDNDNNFKNIEIDFDTRRLLIVLKNILSPIQYYIIYYHIIFKGTNLKILGEMFSVTHERIRQIEEKALEIIKPYLNDDDANFRFILDNYKRQKIKLDLVNIKPIEPVDLVRYLYLKNELTLLERKLFYIELFGNLIYTEKMLEDELLCSREELVKTKESLDIKKHIKFQDWERFKQFSQNILSLCGPLIYDVALKYPNEYEEKEINNCFSKKICSKREIEKDVYLTLLGFKNEYSVSLTKLKDTYLKNLKSFTEEERNYLEICVFSSRNNTEFTMKYPNSHLIENHQYLITKLEMLYYGIKDLLTYHITKENYLFVKDKYRDKLKDVQIVVLDLYFGVNGEALTLNLIAEYLNEDDNKIRILLSSAIALVESLYNNTFKELNINKDLYKPFVNDSRYEFTDLAREILQLYLFENLEYKEIASKLNLSRIKVSNIINDSLRKIDFYRFGIIQIEDISELELTDFFVNKGCYFSKEEKQIIFNIKLGGKSNEDVSKEFEMSLKSIIKILVKFNAMFLEFKVSNVTINEWDVIDEINKLYYDSVLSIKQKQILSLYYGFTNEFNLNTLMLKKTEIAKLFNMDIKTVSENIKRSIINIKARKVGLIRPELMYMNKNLLNDLLDDVHLPITNDQKHIICSLLGLKGYALKTIDELSEEYKRDASSIKKRYQRAIVNINKYINGELEGRLSFEEDVLPNLKFFSKRDTALLIAFFKDNLTNGEIASKYQMKIDYVSSRLHELKNIINSILKGDIFNRFNFEVYRKLIDNPDLPFYGNLALTKVCFELYTGESTFDNYSIPRIKTELNLTCNEAMIRRYIKQLMLSVCRLSNGVKKHVTFTLEDIEDYYEQKKDEMNAHRKEIYIRTLNGNRSEFLGCENDLSETILYDLLKYNNPTLFDLNTISKEEVIAVLRKYYKLLDESVVNALMKLYNINESEFLSKIELKRILKKKDSI